MEYLIPANSKKSMLILGFFTMSDLAVFGIGVVWTIGMLLIIKSTSIWVMLLMVLPALTSAFLVLPIPNYHNMMQLLINIWTFFSSRRRYYWRGWCMGYGYESKSNSK